MKKGIKKHIYNYLLLILILILAFLLRIYNLNWDSGFHLHPDERAIILFTIPLEFPKSFLDFFSSNSSWNPHFFNYGSFPLYFLKICGEIAGFLNPLFSKYEQINIIGRIISVFADLGTIIFIFLIGKKLFNQKISVLASLFYCLSVLSIQSAHFYIVDPILTFFTTLIIYTLILFYEKPTRKKAVIIGMIFGFSLATKSSATVLICSILVAFLVDFFFIFIKSPHRPKNWLHHLPQVVKSLLVDGLIIFFSTIVFFFILEPYAFLDFKNFWQQTMLQRQMTYDPFIFPYTLQYVGKIPYFYEIKNIFLWGQGPIIATICFLGTAYFVISLFKEEKNRPQKLIILSFFTIYFLIVGKFAIGFMRYMLPLYPYLCLFGAVFFIDLRNYFNNKVKSKIIDLVFCSFIFLLILTWPILFISIYSKPNTRVLASEWINKNIAYEAALAVEHWDDELPLYKRYNYKTFILNLYDPDSFQKWQTINSQLNNSDYLIIASNRLYTPLSKLTNCQNLPPDKCYPLTEKYYQKLFNGKLGFKKIAEFTSFPKIEVGKFKIEINDQGADESFTVYDHPKVMIFRNDKKFSSNQTK